MKKLLLVGGGGHCASVADAALRTKEYDELGIVDISNVEPLFGQIPVVGTDDDLPRLKDEGWGYAFVTVGSVGNPKTRKRIFENIEKLGFQIPNIIDPSAVVSEHSHLGKGIFIGKNATVNAGSIVGDGVILNTGSIVEHDCEIGKLAHIATGATLCGGVKVGEYTHIGAGTVIKQYLTIGERCIIGMGSTVIHDVPAGLTVVGNPARVLNKG